MRNSLKSILNLVETALWREDRSLSVSMDELARAHPQKQGPKVHDNTLESYLLDIVSGLQVTSND